MMGDLITADYSVADADVFHDDEGRVVSKDVKTASVRHPPYLKVIRDVDMRIDLSPPPQITKDWVSEMAEGTPIPEAWEKIEYERRYNDFLSSNGASKTLTRLRTVLKHNDVALICTCHAYPFCPRKIIHDRIVEGEVSLTERIMELGE